MSTVEKVAILLRNTWIQCNEFVFADSFKAPSSVVWETEREWEYFHSIMEKTINLSSTISQAEVK